MARRYKRKSKIGSIEVRGKNSCRVKWTDEFKVRHSETVPGTYEDADLYLLKIEQSSRKNINSITFGNYWDAYVEPSFSKLAEKTAHEYRRQWRHDLEPSLKDVRIKDIDWRMCEDVLGRISATSAQQHAYTLLKKILNLAVRDGIIQFNPCDRRIALDKHTKKEKTLLDASEVKAWMSGIRGRTKYEPVLLVLAGSGIRPEEADALYWDDMEVWEHNGNTYVVFRIEKTMVTVGGRTVSRDDTKTEFSRRDAVIGEPFASRLMELCQEGPLVPLVANRSGERTSPAAITQNWRKWCDRNGMKYVSQENMRSSYATMAGEAGADGSLISLSMGHSDGTTRGRNYQVNTRKGMALVADELTRYIEASCN